jgi:hypothetical protein
MVNSPIFSTAQTSFDVQCVDISPDIRLGGPNVAAQNHAYTLELFHADVGDDPIDHWNIDWGDGVTESIPGDAAADHVYTQLSAARTIRVSAVEADTNLLWPNPASPGQTIDYPISVVQAPPDAPGALVIVPLSRSAMQLAWSMPTDTDATGFQIRASADGVNFTAFATITNARTRSFTATGLDANTNYSFRLDAYNDAGDSDYAYTSTASTTDDAWEDMDQVTPDLGYDEDDEHPISWFTPPDGQGDGQYFNPGLYQMLYAGGAYNMGWNSYKWCTGAYFYRIEDSTGYSIQSELGGVGSEDSQEQAEHDAYALGPGLNSYVADEKIGVVFGEYTDPISPGPGVTWTLQRRIPHAGVYSLNDATKEGDTNDPDDTHLAKLWFWRDDRITEDLTLNFDIGGVAEEDDYTAIMKTPDGEGGFTEESIDLASGTITIPAGTFADPIMGIEVDITATDDTDPEWTENLTVRLQDDDETYVADHPYDNDGNDSDGDSSDEDPDAVLYLKDNDLSFDLQQGTLVANYNDTNGNHVTDYEEWGTDSDSDPDLYEMTLNIPSGYEPNSSVTLTTTGGFFNIYDSQSKDNLLSDNGTVTWDDPTNVPHSVWLEVKQGSTSIDDITETLSSTDNGDDQVFDQQNTAVNLKIIADTDPNQDGGGETTNKNRNWLVGQLVDEHVQIDCPPEWKTAPTYDWTAPGDILRDYVRTDALGQRVPVVDDDLVGGQHVGYSQPAIEFFWEDSTVGAVDTKIVSVRVGNINGQNFTLNSTYAVETPPPVEATREQGVEDINDLANPTEIAIYDAAGAPDGEGMLFSAAVRTPAGFNDGDWNFLELWQPDRHWTVPAPALDAGGWHMPNNTLWGLDNWTTYPAYVPGDPYRASGSWSTAQAPVLHSTVDTPRLPLVGRSFASIRDHFSMFIMYRPPGAGSKWVALQVLNWRFNIAATLNAGVWSIDAGHGRSPGSWTVPVHSPEWTRRHINNTQEHD